MGKNNKLSTFDYIIILVIFAVTGTTATLFPKLIMPLFPFEKGTFPYILTYILCITPIYQVLLLGYAFIFGKFQYFWGKQKKMGKWIGRKMGFIKN